VRISVFLERQVSRERLATPVIALLPVQRDVLIISRAAWKALSAGKASSMQFGFSLQDHSNGPGPAADFEEWNLATNVDAGQGRHPN